MSTHNAVEGHCYMYCMEGSEREGDFRARDVADSELLTGHVSHKGPHQLLNTKDTGDKLMFTKCRVGGINNNTFKCRAESW